MKVLISLCFLLSVSSPSMGVDMFGGIMKQAQGMAQGMVKQAQDAMNMGMQVFSQAAGNVPFQDVVTQVQSSMESAFDPQKMMKMLQDGAAKATEMGEGAASQTMQMFNEGIKQMGDLQNKGAKQGDYMDLLKQMQGPLKM